MSVRPVLLILFLLVVTPAAFGGIASSYDEPDTTLASNSVIDIVAHNNWLWFGTGAGVNFTKDSGETFLLYNSGNGLVSDDISAVFSIESRLWIASNHNQQIGRDLHSFSDGLSYSDDNGMTWTQIDFGAGGLNIPRVFGINQTVYDIAGHTDEDRGIDWLFFPAFAGGFLASQDNGQSWRRVWATRGDSAQWVNSSIPSLRNRYFSAAVDTSHGDSLVVWAGTAGGLVQHIFAKEDQRLESKYVADIAFSDPFTGDLNSHIYLGGDNGVTLLGNRGVAIRSTGINEGLPGPFVSSLIEIGGRLILGTRQSIDGPSTGLAYSDDMAQSFVALPGVPEVIGANRSITDFALIRNRLYLAAEGAGLWVSPDTGVTWQHIFVDSSDMTPANRRNVVHAAHAFEDILMLGTDSGIVFYYYDTAGAVDSTTTHQFEESLLSSASVRRINSNDFRDSTGVLDSLVIWTANVPLTAEGSRMMARSGDYGATWTPYRFDDTTLNIDFLGDSTFRVGPDGIEYSVASIGPDPQFPYASLVRDSQLGEDLDDDTVTAMAVKGSTVLFAAANGYAVSFNRGSSYTIYRNNPDSLHPDRTYIFNSGSPGFVSEFIPALDVQYVGDEPARIWVSGHPSTSGGDTAITLGLVVPIDVFGLVVHPDSLEKAVKYEYRWEAVVPGVFAWNFGFNGDTVFACTNEGLLMNYGDTGLTWDTIAFVDTAGTVLIDDDDSVLSALVYAGKLWVGTTGRTVLFDLATLIADTSFVYVDYETPASEVYAFPVPYSHARDRSIKFHFTLERPTTVTIEVYDFAMNLVARPLDNVFFDAGIQQSTDSRTEGWSVLTDDSEPVAVGMYYFKVEFGTGEVRWGKLAVIP